MKRRNLGYEEPEMDFICLVAEDIICSSPNTGDGETEPDAGDWS